MKKFLVLFVFLLNCACIIARPSEVKEVNDHNYYLIQTKMVVTKKIMKEYLYNDKTIVLSLGLDFAGNIAELAISKNVGKAKFLKMKAAIENGETCFTSCTRINKCSDKSDWGAALCAGECLIDCAAKLIREIQDEALQNSTSIAAH